MAIFSVKRICNQSFSFIADIAERVPYTFVYLVVGYNSTKYNIII